MPDLLDALTFFVYVVAIAIAVVVTRWVAWDALDRLMRLLFGERTINHETERR